MSLVFNQTSSPYNGLIQRCEVNVYGEDGLGRISGNSKLLGLWTTRINLGLDRAFSVILNANRGDQTDDINHTDYPTLFFDLVANQRDYSFSTDENSNLILEIQDAYVLDNGIYRKLDRVNEKDDIHFYNGNTDTGQATKYGIKGSGLFLDRLPAANLSNGLKVEVNREASYFATTDTTKKPGFSGQFHHYLADWATFDYAKTNVLRNTNITAQYIASLEQEMRSWYARQSKHEGARMTPTYHNNR